MRCAGKNPRSPASDVVFVEAGLMMAHLDFDISRLSVWLVTHLGAGYATKNATKFLGGQSNPTYRVETGEGSVVLRRKPFGPLLPSAHAIEREFRLLSALSPIGFPVPKPLGLCDDPEVIGAPFYIMAMVAGETFWQPMLPELIPERQRALYHSAIDTLAQLHLIDPATVGLENFGKPTDFFARQVNLWIKQYRAAQTDEIDEMERLIAWLPATLPSGCSVSIVHGDYRLDNLMFEPGASEIWAIIDWELATLGDPLADFTYFLMRSEEHTSELQSH